MTTHEIELHHGTTRVVLRPALGGRIAGLEIDGRQLIRREHDADALGWAYWGAYPLLPWSNRIPDGRFDYDGTAWQLEPNWPDGTAIHGLTAWTPWDVVSADARHARLETSVDHEPWRLTGWSRFELSHRSLQWELGARNVGDLTVPIGLGIHPWFPAGNLTVAADSIWPAEGCIPTGPPRPVEPAEDLRTGRTPPVLDACFTGLSASELTVSGVEMSWEGPVTQVVACTVDAEWYAIEPVTNANDGFNLAARGVERHGVIDLAPGEHTSVTYTLTSSSGS